MYATGCAAYPGINHLTMINNRLVVSNIHLIITRKWMSKPRLKCKSGRKKKDYFII